MNNPNLKSFEEDAIHFATKAVEYDQQNQIQLAAFYYIEAAEALLRAAELGSTIESLKHKAEQYIARAETLKRTASQHTLPQFEAKTAQQLQLERAKFLLAQGLDQDEEGNDKDATELYMEAVQLCLDAKKHTHSAELQTRLQTVAKQALERVEALKDKGKTVARPVAAAGPRRGTGAAFTKDEIEVLRRTSCINGREYVPFLDVDLRERFAYPLPFVDPHGFLALAPKQRARFKGWVRPEDFASEPRMIYLVSSYSIRQTLISDCSFVASLAISAQYERRFQKKLITSIIYPQNQRGEPGYNPCGKYTVKLNINGVPRKVVIDDYLPMGNDGELLCSYSTNKNELWVSLLEKAYMKVMGGYDFPGSNSNIDLHALTGWIPERLAIHSAVKDFDSDKEFERILDRFHKGHVLVTIATGDLGEAEADRAGLVPCHAYAMLDIRKLHGKRLLLLKNPWSHLRWKGNYSELDERNWTSELQKELNYDRDNAQLVDNGVFWIDYESLLRFFDVIYLNWTPDLFSHSTCFHRTWSVKEGPRKDTYNVGDNPQYSLTVQSPGKAAVWIHLLRHITDKDDFADNKEFIAMVVYKSDGKRIYYPYDPAPMIEGVRINSPHYLSKMVIDQPGVTNYTLVVSQYDKNHTIHYTMRVHSTCPIQLNEIIDPFNPKFTKELTGQWRGRSAGGCANNRETYGNNPVYQIHLDNQHTNNVVKIELRAPKELSIGFDVTCVKANAEGAGRFDRQRSGEFRRGFVVFTLDNIPGGVYNVCPCTFFAGQEASFFLNVESSHVFQLSQLQ